MNRRFAKCLGAGWPLFAILPYLAIFLLAFFFGFRFALVVAALGIAVGEASLYFAYSSAPRLSMFLMAAYGLATAVLALLYYCLRASFSHFGLFS